MLLITYATHNSGYINALSESSKRMGFELIILGQNKKWEGFMQKLFDIIAFLKTQSKNEIICFVDGFDVLTLGTKDEFINKFKSFNTDKVIFSAHKDNYFLEVIFGKINVKDSNVEYNRLCSGTYVGYCHKIIELFENICKISDFNNEDDDQNKLTQCYNKCKDCIQLDTNNTLFYCVETSSDMISEMIKYINLVQKKQIYMEDENVFYFIRDNRLILKNNNNKPVFVQGNGNINMDNLAKKLNLPLKVTENRNYFDYSTKKFIFKILQRVLGYCIIIIHLLFTLFMILTPYITNNVYILLAIIIINVFILTQWFLYGTCFLNKIENGVLEIDNSTYENGTDRSSLLYFFEKCFGERNAYIIVSLIPVITSTYAAYKIIKVLHKKIPFNFKI
jgi:hypothetical protein